ncbi:trans-sulfuration enzyme family protein [Parasulfitobacter algicola]|uniref:Aminotransferase class I/II-fold pyridoxal phosphate-dependent enzyme n=1 Tax=Parasulfitobacter algicola TaxID=2614809 RepID=A0ABX2IYI6_9RHOB|nr:aminotransferase class I/II-fold pyridoxal phosphate-dependent enzyme [Sulfitobacter algicola]NSX55313.1 aminotransferase class I/II-fold pyridoxal phosphate-dependent enzyme [Sulfitobacter algicola]
MKKTFVRRGHFPASASRPVVSPLQPSVVYASDSPDMLDDQYDGITPGFVYSREGHANATALATLIDGLEGAEGGIVVSSGMAAVTAVMLGLLKAGDHVVGGSQLYGRSLRMLADDLPRFGIETSLADSTDADAMAQAIRPNTKLILVEVVSNPTIRVADMEGIAALCKENDTLLAVDNTFTTPRGYSPFDNGADIIIHSVTKLLAGHSDAMLGYVAAKDPAHSEQLDGIIATLGLTASPFDCWLAERGLYTFDLRYERACQNAKTLADHIADHPMIKRVIYPTRPDHPDHNRAQFLLNGQGGNMLSFEIDGGRNVANAFVKGCENLAFAPTLGDINTTISHPASSSHRALTEDQRLRMGVQEGFFRLSVGVEDINLLQGEIIQGLNAAKATS